MKKILLIFFLALAAVLAGCGFRTVPAKAEEAGLPGASGTENRVEEPVSLSVADMGGESLLPEHEGDSGEDGPESVGGRPSESGALSVDGIRLVGQDGKTVQLRGVSTHGLAWFPGYVNRELFAELSEDWGINAVRLAMYTAEYGGYCSGGDQAALQQLICDGVEYAGEADMYAIVDWHILSDGDPNIYKSQAVEFFKTVTEKLVGHDNVIYEICNEPNGGTTWEQIKAYAQEVIPVIRANAPDAVILVGTPNWSQFVDQAAADPITGYDNLMYTLHFYAATHKADLRGRMTAALESGLPIFVSEYGICDASGNGAIDAAEADRWADTMDQWGVSYMMWSLCNKAESASIIRSSCQKTAGLAETDLSEAGTWLLGRLSGTASGSPSEEPGSSASADPALPEPSYEDISGEEGDLKWVLEVTNSWESGGSTFRQYSLTVMNTGKTAVSAWSVPLNLGAAFEVQSSWNGGLTPAGQTLTVTPADYNSSIPAGGSVGDIGFIVKF